MASTYELIIKAVDQTSGPLNKVQRSLDRVNASSKKAGKGMQGVSGGANVAGFAALGSGISKIGPALLGVTAAAATVGIAFNKVIDATREFETIQNQLKLVTNGTQDLADTTEKLRNMAVANRTSFAATAELYTKLKVSTEELGMSTSDVEDITTKLSQALQVAGADAGTSAGVIKQFGQAMASGVVRGDEFNSIVEGLGPALSIMARESGITVGELRKMAMDGELTAEVFANMLLKSNALTESFDKMSRTISQTEVIFGDVFDELLVDIGKATGATSGYNKILEGSINMMKSWQAAIAGEDSFAKLGDSTTIEGLNHQLEETKKILEGLNKNTTFFQRFGSAGNAIALQTNKLNQEIRRLTLELEKLQKKQDAAALLNYKDAIVLIAEARKREEKAVSDLITKGLEPYLKLIKQNIGTDSIFELAGPIDQAKMKIAELKEAQVALTAANNNAGVKVDNYKGKMEGLSQAIIIQEAALKKLTAEAANAGTGLSGLDLFMHNLTKNSETAAQELMFAQQAIAILNSKVGKTMSIDVYAQAMLTLQGNVKKAKDEINKILNPLSAFDQFMEDLKNESMAAATEQTHFLMAAEALLDMLNKKKISIDAYAFGMERIKEATEGAAKAVKENTDAFKIGLSTQESLAMVQKQIAAEDELLARKKAVLEAGGGGEKLFETLGFKKAELTFEQELRKEYTEKAKELKDVSAALQNVSTIAKETGVTEKELTKVLQDQQQVLQESLGLYQAKALTVSEAIEKGFTDMSMGIGKELATAIRTGENLFDALGNSFNRMLDNILQQILESQINAALGELFNVGPTPGGGGGLGSLLTGFLGTPTVGAPMGGLKLPFLANGGIAKGGSPHIVGERGPELFVPNTTGKVVSNEELNSGSDAPIINFNINAISTQDGIEFLIQNKPQIINMVTQGYNQRGRAGITG